MLVGVPPPYKQRGVYYKGKDKCALNVKRLRAAIAVVRRLLVFKQLQKSVNQPLLRRQQPLYNFRHPKQNQRSKDEVRRALD